MKSPHKRKYVLRYAATTWHLIHKKSFEWAKESSIFHPDDEVISRCGKAFSYRADDVFVEKGHEALCVDKLPRGAKVCGNCRRLP